MDADDALARCEPGPSRTLLRRSPGAEAAAHATRGSRPTRTCKQRRNEPSPEAGL